MSYLLRPVLIAISAVTLSRCFTRSNSLGKTDKKQTDFLLSAIMVKLMPSLLILYAIFVIYDLTLAINAIYPILDTSSFESICPNGTPYHARPPMNVFEWISYIAIISGGLWRLWAMRTLGRLFTFEISIRASHEVITTGPYAWVRHPSYTSGLIAGSGGIMMLFMAQVWPCSGVQYSETKMMAFIVMFFSLGTYGSLGRIKKEEEALRKEFGPKWVEYTKKTPYLMIPGIY